MKNHIHIYIYNKNYIFQEVIIEIGNTCIHKQLAKMFFRRTLDSVKCNQTWHKVSLDV